MSLLRPEAHQWAGAATSDVIPPRLLHGNHRLHGAWLWFPPSCALFRTLRPPQLALRVHLAALETPSVSGPGC